MGEREDSPFLETLVSYRCCLHSSDTWEFIGTFFMPLVQGLEQCWEQRNRGAFEEASL